MLSPPPPTLLNSKDFFGMVERHTWLWVSGFELGVWGFALVARESATLIFKPP